MEAGGGHTKGFSVRRRPLPPGSVLPAFTVPPRLPPSLLLLLLHPQGPSSSSSPIHGSITRRLRQRREGARGRGR